MSTLDAELLAAHAVNDKGALCALYTQAADQATGTAQSFYLTQAYVFALEMGLPEADVLRARLIDLGCETPLQSAITSPR